MHKDKENRDELFGSGSEAELDAEFESKLQRAMRRVDVRAETTAKFFALAAEAERKRHAMEGRGPRLVKPSNGGRVLVFPKVRPWVGGAIAAVLAVGVFVGEQAYRQHQRQQAEQQFDTAMRVTDHALEQAQAQLRHAGVRLPQLP